MEKLFNNKAGDDNNIKIYKKKIKKDKKNNINIDNELDSSKFRVLNELLYKNDSKSSMDYFKNQNEDFITYHKGYLNQIKKWEIKPLNYIINYIIKNSKNFKNLTVVDHGCGNGEFYENKNMQSIFKQILSYDLIALKNFIKSCDIKNLPWEKASVDLSIFSLSLMGTNYLDFLLESNRVLKINGHLIICEVVSRINDVNLFIKIIKEIGFNLVQKKQVNNYFNFFIFKKINNKENYLIKKNKNFLHFNKNYKNISLLEISRKTLIPCIYKKR